MFDWLQRLFSPAPRARPAEPASAPVAPVAPAAPAALAGLATAAMPAAAPVQPAAVQSPVAFEQRDRVDDAYQQWLFDGDGGSDLDTSPAEQQVLDALDAIVASQQSGAALVRRLPGLLPQLLQSLRSDNFSSVQLSRTISSDVVLVAAVIRLANNAVKGTGATISSVEHAVMLIGQEGLRHLITSVAFRPIIDMNSGRFTRTLAPRIWDQSERCATAARMLAEDMGSDPFEAFLAGLTQNVGLIVALRVMDQMAKDDKRLGSALFCARLIGVARVLTCSIGREWHFPEAVTRAIGEQAGMRKGAALSPLGRLLTLSDYLSKMHLLTGQGRLARDDAALFSGLPARALTSFHALDADDSMTAGAAGAPLAAAPLAATAAARTP